jgi:hypothetical protein
MSDTSKDLDKFMAEYAIMRLRKDFEKRIFKKNKVKKMKDKNGKPIEVGQKITITGHNSEFKGEVEKYNNCFMIKIPSEVVYLHWFNESDIEIDEIKKEIAK